jgi:hypothetical protein
MKLWYTYTMENYLATRNNDMRFEVKWMHEEHHVSDVSQDQKQKRHMFSLITGG